jgi:hypothetical protein
VIVTFVALPPKVFPPTVNEAVPHELPEVLLRVTVGLFEHCAESLQLIIKIKQPKHNVLVIFSL